MALKKFKDPSDRYPMWCKTEVPYQMADSFINQWELRKMQSLLHEDGVGVDPMHIFDEKFEMRMRDTSPLLEDEESLDFYQDRWGNDYDMTLPFDDRNSVSYEEIKKLTYECCLFAKGFYRKIKDSNK